MMRGIAMGTLFVGVVVAVLVLSMAMGQDLSALTDALEAARDEAQDSIIPAVAGIFGVVVLLGAAGLVVSRIARGS
jgi:hypothetical protein